MKTPRRAGRPRRTFSADDSAELTPEVSLARERWIASGYTLSEASGLTGIPISTLSMIFGGKIADPSFGTMKALLGGFGISIRTEDSGLGTESLT